MFALVCGLNYLRCSCLLTFALCCGLIVSLLCFSFNEFEFGCFVFGYGILVLLWVLRWFMCLCLWVAICCRLRLTCYLALLLYVLLGLVVCLMFGLVWWLRAILLAVGCLRLVALDFGRFTLVCGTCWMFGLMWLGIVALGGFGVFLVVVVCCGWLDLVHSALWISLVVGLVVGLLLVNLC